MARKSKTAFPFDRFEVHRLTPYAASVAQRILHPAPPAAALSRTQIPPKCDLHILEKTPDHNEKKTDTIIDANTANSVVGRNVDRLLIMFVINQNFRNTYDTGQVC